MQIRTLPLIALAVGTAPSAAAFSASTKQLTERQLQFWEDVEDGLDDIEQFWEKQGQSIDRIRLFGKSARGEVPPPVGVSSFHEPSEEHIDGLTAKPYWDAKESPALFPWAAELEAKADVIQEEFQAQNAKQFASDSVWQNQVMGGGWSAIRLQRLGEWNGDNCAAFPATYQLLRSLQIPLAVRGVCFARQAPGSGVQPHSDGRNFILTAHLGIDIPEGCWIDVGGERKGWETGQLTTLDTSFQHATGNPSESDRNVLILDFWHPELSEAERAALEFVYSLRNKFDTGAVPPRRPRSLAQEEEGGLGKWFSNLMSGDEG